MRMWNVNPELLCRKHLLGEHVEMHMFMGTIAKGRSIGGYLENKLVNPAMIRYRHDQLAYEMVKRGYNHQSPLTKPALILPFREINVVANMAELARRCPECKRLQNEKR